MNGNQRAEIIRIVPSRSTSTKHDIATRLRLFDQATARQRHRQESASLPIAEFRGWTREQLYDRGGTD
ncbi:MAG: hypothetical protein M3120_00770 [Pseudomonadota bacterium]|nr:hypothetical protein [Pseudomonadota bacterium]